LASADHFPGRWDVLICDESHYLRNATASRAQQILGRDGLVHRAGFTWLLSGTPAVNNYGELWTALHVFGVYLKSYESFVAEFCITKQTPYGLRVVGSTNHEKLRALMAPIWLRRKLAAVAPDMPPIVLEDYVIEAPRGYADCFPPEVAAALESGDPVTALECLSEHTATVRRLVGVAKVPGAAELAAQDLDGNADKLVLFTYHRQVAEGLAKLLAEYQPALIYGGQTEMYRAREIARFQTDPTCRVAIAQILAAGTAIDLSVASHALFVEYDWVPGNNAQAAMRLQNFNKKHPVTARFLALRGSIDGRIAAVFRRKTTELTKLFG
jgi:SNF2 family DNA or RNA helicase